MIFRQLFDPETSTYTYLLADPSSREAVLIDAVAEQVERDLTVLDELGVRLRYTLETHVHADHVTGASLLRDRVGSQSVVHADAGAACADVLVRGGDRVRVGSLEIEVRETPGHTNGDVVYVVGDRVFTGDTLLIGGCGRTDFQEGDPGRLYDSVHSQLFTLSPATLVYPGHDYRGNRVSTIAEEMANNARLGGGRDRDSFIALMRNLNLPYPKKIDVAVPANRVCGRLPQAAGSGPQDIRPGDAASRLSEMHVVDVRQPDEFDGGLGHIAGAVLVPLGDLEGALDRLPRAEDLLVVCRSGRRSGQACDVLARHGFSRLYNLDGGVLAWVDAGLPTTRDSR